MVTLNDYPILDVQFLEFFKSYNSPKLVWNAILQIGGQINKNNKDLSTFKTPIVNLQINPLVLTEKIKISESTVFDAYAACLIAEEQKKSTKLGKRIKLLAAYQVLFENYTPEDAAKFSKGKKWQDIDALCKTRGF
ncbi:DUF7004 family protein [Anabaena azotica]|uniref:PIN domain-containing protein n=1 Tax=Anabaena azotica FACHB-119 TaxID=947527 RepID=A0ABR8DDZ8_9NOST|nr:hypothetical protein [Anabaena azotica]MBD2505289.1 hypothetical protein [Anabaena azotica FACHB-119]